MSRDTVGDGWEFIEALGEPTRRRVFDVVRAARAPLTRDEVAAAAGTGRSLAAFHLDRLADAGLLAVDFARPPGRRGGPGAGRPAKRYRPADVQVELTMPPRRYALVARLLTAGVAESPQDAARGAEAAAVRAGRDVGAGCPRPRRGRRAAAEATCAALRGLGYEPRLEDGTRVRLTNCPFDEVVDVSPEVVCGVNLGLVTGVLDGLGVTDRLTAVLDRIPPDCCVVVEPPAGPA